MIMVNYFIGFIMVLMVFSTVVLGVVSVPYYGVVSIMGISLFYCIFMVILGRTFVALVMYIVYLGGLVVVFGYCVSVEKDVVIAYGEGQLKYSTFFAMVVNVLLWACFGEVGGLLEYVGWEDLVCLEVNGGGVFYFDGGVGLIVCSWGLLVVLFSILIILSWSRLGGLRPF